MHQRDRSVVLFRPHGGSNLYISSSVSHTVRSAPPLRSSVVSQSTRCLSCHLDTSRYRNPSHLRITVARSAMGRSFVTFFGIGEHRVVKSPTFVPRFSRDLNMSPLGFFWTSPAKLSGENRHSPRPLLSYISSLPSPNSLLPTSAALTPKFSAFSFLHGCSSRSCTSVLHCQCFAHSFPLFPHIS